MARGDPPYNMRKIMLVGASPAIDTGFSKTLRYIADGLYWGMKFPDGSHKYQPSFFGWWHNPKMRPEIPYKIYQTQQRAGSDHDKWGQVSLVDAIQIEQPEIVLSAADTWTIDHIRTLKNRKSFVHVHYMAVDGQPVPRKMLQKDKEVDWQQILGAVDHLVTYTEYGKREVNKMMGREVAKTVIGSGVDTVTLHPATPEEKAAQRNRLFPGLPPGAFLLGFFSRNQPRKSLDKMIHAVSKFQHEREKEGRPVYLYLHCALKDPAGWNIPELMEYFNVKKNRLLVDRTIGIGQGVSEEELRNRYICCDATLLPTKGEGWGMTIQESMACGIPVLTTDYSAHPEYCREGSLFIKAAAYEMDNNLVTNRVIVSVTDFVDKIAQLYNSATLREKLGKAGRQKSLELSTDKVVGLWENFLDSVDTSGCRSYTDQAAEELLENGVTVL